MWLPHLPHEVSRSERSTFTSRDWHEPPLKSMSLTSWFLITHRCYADRRYVCSWNIIKYHYRYSGTTPNSCQLFQYSHHFGYIACCCICFVIILLFMSEIYCPILTVSSTMPSVFHILRWPSLVCDSSASSSALALSPSLPSSMSTSLVHRSSLASLVEACHRRLMVGKPSC